MAGRSAKDVYESHMLHIVDQVWKREGDTLLFDPVSMNTPLCEVIEGERSSRCIDVEDLPIDQASLAEMEREELMATVLQLIEERDDMRRSVLQTLLNYFFAEGINPLKVAERIFIVARTVSQTHVWNMRQTEAASLFGYIRQTWQQMEKRCVEELIARLSTTGKYTVSGGKSWSARERYSEDKRGNTSRRLGRKKGDLQP